MIVIKIDVNVLKYIHHSCVKVPVLFINGEPFVALLDYMFAKQLSPAKNEKLTHAVALFLEYMIAFDSAYDSPAPLIQSFVAALYDGTIGADGVDPNGLYWQPRTVSTSNRIVHQLTEFSDHLVELSEDFRSLNPWRKANGVEEKLRLVAWTHKKRNSFLGHTIGKKHSVVFSSRTRSVNLNRSPMIDPRGEVRAFPEDRVTDLLLLGFLKGRNKGKIAPRFLSASTHSLRDILITLLLHFGGLRVSEPFHLLVTDVLSDPADEENSYVRIFHPSAGLAPEKVMNEHGRKVNTNRKNWLLTKYGLKPRNELNFRAQQFAGWKDLRLDDGQTASITVQWFPSSAGKLFKKLWDYYLIERANLMKGPESHPFAFVTRTGNPYSIDSYQAARNVACRRICVTVAESLGTNTHAHRHAYGTRLAEAGVSDMEIMVCMHHKSINSQLVYTAPTQQRVREVLQDAEDTLRVKLDKDGIYVHSCVDEVGVRGQLQDIENLVGKK